MQKEISSCQFIVAGVSEGFALVSSETFSFWGGLDPKTGKIIDPKSNLFGESIRGRIFVYPGGRGSSTTSAILLEAIRRSNAPSAIINIEVEPIIAIGVLVAQEIYHNVVLPIAAVPADKFQLLKTGDYLLVNSIAGKLYRKDLPQ
jgi:predicted aconitase with swiveling domain